MELQRGSGGKGCLAFACVGVNAGTQVHVCIRVCVCVCVCVCVPQVCEANEQVVRAVPTRHTAQSVSMGQQNKL